MGSYTLTIVKSTVAGKSRSNVLTSSALTIPSNERFRRYKIHDNETGMHLQLGLCRYGTSTSMSYDTWYTDTSWINWTSGNKATVRFYNDDNSSYSVQNVQVIFETVPLYDVTCVVSPEGGGTLTANYAKAASGDTVTLTVTTNEGYEFLGFTSTVTITNNQFTMPASAVTITANFKQKHKPVKVYNGEEFVKCTMNYYDGTQFVECETYYYDGTDWVPISTT